MMTAVSPLFCTHRWR